MRADRTRMQTRTRSRALAAALLALVLAGCGAADGPGPADASSCSAPAAPLVVRTEVSGEDVVMTGPADGSARAVVLYLHGSDEPVDVILTGSSMAPVTQALVEAGYAVASSDAEGNNFGSPSSQQDYLALLRQAQERFGTDVAFFLAVSMGGLDALPLAASGEVEGLRGIAGISPAFSLFAPSALATEGWAGWVEYAWGTAPTAAEDPLALPADRFAGQRFRFYVADADDVVLTSEHSGPFTAAVSGVADVSTVGCTGGHVDPSCYQPEDLVAWFDGLAP